MTTTPHATRQQLQASHELVHAIVESSPNGIVTIDEEGIIQSFNPTAERLFDYTATEVIGKNISILISGPDHSRHDGHIQHYIKTGKARILNQHGREVTGLKKGNNPIPIELMVTEMWIGDQRYFLSFMRDISERRKQDAQLEYMATHDRLTGLMNRTQLTIRMDIAAANNTPFLLFYLELDRFQPINEVLGHSIGDQVLVKVGEQLALMSNNSEQVAYIGGSTFAFLCLNPKGSINALDMARSLYSCLEAPLELKQFSIDTEVSIGITCHPGHGNNAVDLLRYAQIAMHSARRRQIMFAIYDDEMEFYQLEHLSLASELRHAIEADELVVYYQPKVDINNKQIIGVEALVRWQHPKKGLMRPDLFIPLAEDTGIIYPFTAWLINEVSHQIRQWQDSGTDLLVAINLAPRNLLEADLPEKLNQAIIRWDIKPSNLMIEITERGLMTEPRRAMTTLHRIHEIGIGISIDDFGTGYSSLAYLKDLPVDELKIDKVFVDAMEHDTRSLTIVQMIIQMAHFLGLEVIAEGVESEGDWRRLELLGCDRAQGYYMGRPMPTDELERWLLQAPGNWDQQVH